MKEELPAEVHTGGAQPSPNGTVEEAEKVEPPEIAPSFHLTFTGPEANLIYQLLVESRFGEAGAKFVAASAQQKIEQLAHQNGQPE